MLATILTATALIGPAAPPPLPIDTARAAIRTELDVRARAMRDRIITWPNFNPDPATIVARVSIRRCHRARPDRIACRWTVSTVHGPTGTVFAAAHGDATVTPAGVSFTSHARRRGLAA